MPYKKPDEDDETGKLAVSPRPRRIEGIDGVAGVVQMSQIWRSTEHAAEQLTEQNAEAFARLIDEMLKQGRVLCHGHCGLFRPVEDFTRDERNTGRLGCHSYCKTCRAESAASKRQAAAETLTLPVRDKRAEGLRRKDRKKKRKKKR